MALVIDLVLFYLVSMTFSLGVLMSTVDMSLVLVNWYFREEFELDFEFSLWGSCPGAYNMEMHIVYSMIIGFSSLVLYFKPFLILGFLILALSIHCLFGSFSRIVWARLGS